MEIAPIVTPDLYVSLLVLSLATISFRQIARSLARARRARVTLVPAHTSEPEGLPTRHPRQLRK